MREQRSPLRWVALAAAGAFAVVIIAVFSVRHYTYSHDDAFISYTYAKNLAQGHGLVFNQGERVWGFTSPLQVMLLGALAFLGLDLPPTSFFLSIIWISLTSLLVFRLSGRLFRDGWSRLGISLLFLFGGGSFYFLGLESSLLAFLQCLFLVLLLENRARLAALVAGLSCLARPDSLLLVVPVLLLGKETRARGNLLLFLVPGLIWSVFAFFYYGTQVPNTLHGKAGMYGLGEYLRAGFGYLAGAPFHEEWMKPVPLLRILDRVMAAAAPVLLPLLSLSSLANPQVRRVPVLGYALVAYPWLLILSYAVIGAPISHNWETYSAFFFFRLSVMVGFWSLLRLLLDRLSPAPPRSGAVRAGVVAGVFLGVLALVAVDVRDLASHLEKVQTTYWYGGRHSDYLAISRWIDGNLPPGSTLGLLEPGTIGYYTRLHIIDMGGLVTRGDSPPGRIPDYRYFVERYRPQYLLLEEVIDTPFKVEEGLWYLPERVFPKGSYRTFTLMRRFP